MADIQQLIPVIPIRSAKRGKAERNGIHGWHPYYAGYSENFVLDILRFFRAAPGSVILDPWIGSGTTAVVCQKENIKCIGVDINPVLTIFSKAKCARLLEFDLILICEGILSQVKISPLNADEQLDIIQYLLPDDYAVLKAIKKAVEQFFEILIIASEIKEHLFSFFYSAIFRCIREIGLFSTGSNPTWICATASSGQKQDVCLLFREMIAEMVKDINCTFSCSSASSPLPNILIGDSKNLPVASESIDCVITSPPYLTRIDYAMSTKPELLFMGYNSGDSFDSIRRATMGVPVICDKSLRISDQWGNTCTQFLSRVETHSSKAARSYYLPIFLQYFRDAYNSLIEINRVLKAGGRACLVVQTSYFKEIEINVDKIYVEMGEQLGMHSSIGKREQVRQHIAHLNTKSTSYSGKKVYYESLIMFHKQE